MIDSVKIKKELFRFFEQFLFCIAAGPGVALCSLI